LSISYQIGILFIAFYISYWTIKVFESYYYVLTSYITLLRTNKKDYSDYPVILSDAKHLLHIVIVPIYSEPYDVIAENIESIIANDYPYRENIIVLLATEERGIGAKDNADKIVSIYSGASPVKIVNVVHPADIPGEGKVKGSNITYAIKQYIEMNELDDHMTFVSTIDTDTLVEPNFFLITSYTFLSTEHNQNAIYQYTPVYANNWHKGTFFARLIGMGTTFWQLSESQNPEFYRNFAVYGQSLYCLKKADFWSLTSIVEDGFQYWRSYFAFDGKFRIVNVPAVCRMDIVEEETFLKTVRSQYKQLRRWSWGCTDIEFVIPQFVNNPHIPLFEKLKKTIYLIFNHLFWAGGAFMLFFIGYIPGIFSSVHESIISLTIPLITSFLFTWIFATIIFPSIISILIMKKYTIFRKRDYIFNILQWALIPILTLTLFSLPAIESQLRLFFGKRLGTFETTQKMKRK
jgi:cellulose synthase/poly-beta-1,6-N-acetylglucosamine synthase-like glycosyltransferase